MPEHGNINLLSFAQSHFNGWALDPGTLGFSLPFRDFVEASASAGFDFVEVPVMEALKFASPNQLSDLFREYGVRPGVFSCPWDLPANSSVDDNLFEERLARIPSLCKFIKAAGATKVSVFFNGSRPGMVKLTFSQLTDRCRRLAEAFNVYGIQLCIELNDSDYLCLAGDVLASIGLPYDEVAILFDCFHMYRSRLQLDWLKALPICSLGWVHMSDVPIGMSSAECEAEVRTIPTQGKLDFVSILETIAGLEYNGPLSLEVLPVRSSHGTSFETARRILSQTRHGLAQLSHP